jgi:hypothetical protein
VALLCVPPLDEDPWPTLGGQVCDFLEERAIFGPGSLKGEPYRIDAEFRAQLHRAYEVYPKGHAWAGRRRFKRVGISVRKGLAKTEKLALLTYVELHAEGPVRCDGFDAYGQPVGRPVRDPYIPLLAVTVEQVEELAYGALYVIVTEGPDADLFDASLERVIRLDEHGRADGKAVPLANSPGARDGARTTFQGFDEPHRLFLPRQVAAHETMVANLEKRVLEDPWGAYVGTAGEPGQGSIAEGLHDEAQKIDRGEIDDPQLFYFYRWAGKAYDLADLEQRVEAVSEATGPIGEYGPGQFHSIAKQWDRPKADKKYLERVWLNRWTKSGAQAFDVGRWEELCRPEPIPRGALVVAGFDGARFRDSTGIVLTDVETGRQQLWATWERPLDAEEWEVPEDEVTAAWEQVIETFDLWLVYGDPPHWTETYGSWAGRWPDVFEEWWTQRVRAMAFAVRDYVEGQQSGAVTHVSREGNELDEAFDAHIAAAGRKDVKIFDDDPDNPGRQLFVLQKIHPDRKFDNAMAGCLSWQAYLEAVKKGAQPRKYEFVAPARLR